jgi:hypothetical protein
MGIFDRGLYYLLHGFDNMFRVYNVRLIQQRFLFEGKGRAWFKERRVHFLLVVVLLLLRRHQRCRIRVEELLLRARWHAKHPRRTSMEESG